MYMIHFMFIAELLTLFLIGEGKLETFLLENPPLESNIQKARNGLHEAKKYLVKASCKEAGEVCIRSLFLFLYHVWPQSHHRMCKPKQSLFLRTDSIVTCSIGGYQ
jgi:hypothetical protein